VGVLWKLQEILGKKWNELSISILSTGGKGGILKSKIIFEGFNIPTYICFDKDRSNDRENRRLLRSVLHDTSTMPENKVHEKWAYNDHNMETELNNMLSENTCEEIWDEINELLDCDDTRIRKNPEVTAKFVELVYERKLSLSHFEEIINAIDKLYSSYFRI